MYCVLSAVDRLPCAVCCRVLFVVPCLLCVVCCVLFAVCCALCAVRCLLSVVRCSLFLCVACLCAAA